MVERYRSSSRPTPHPRTVDEERLSRLRLLRSHRVGPVTYGRLLAEYGSAGEALRALPEKAKAAGIERYEPCPEGVVSAELKAGARVGARLLMLGDADYPPALAQIDQPPVALWVRGRLELLQREGVALVGARNASSLGTRMARALGAGLGAAGKIVTSGLARGVDAAAHTAALETGTIAALGGGVDVVYPSENATLMDRIADVGVLVSEQPMGLRPMARHFPARNRLISGLSRAVVVVEAAAKSGTLITARYAIDQGREVLAVPGHPFDARAAGCLHLIRDGATLVRSAEDVLEALRPIAPAVPASQTAPPPRRTLRDTAALHRKILDRLGPSPVTEDQLRRDLDAGERDFGASLVDLEMDGKIERHSGGLVVRVS
ncbi:MAG: DNA-processing protein DprA [Shimia sp.]